MSVPTSLPGRSRRLGVKSMPNLTHLDIYGDKITETVPASFADFEDMVQLILSITDLTGDVDFVCMR